MSHNLPIDDKSSKVLSLLTQIRVCYNPFAMSKYITPIDISNIPALRRIVEEMKHTKQPRLLKEDSKTVAMLMPLGTALETSTDDIWVQYNPTNVQRALQQSAGTLTGVNRENLLKDIANERTQESHKHSI